MTAQRYITVKLTQREAEALGIIKCRCGHPPNNHFKLNKKHGICAHLQL